MALTGIQTLDLRQVCRHHFARRHLFPGQPRGQFDGAHLAQFRSAGPPRRLRRNHCRTEQLMDRGVNAAAGHRGAEAPAAEARVPPLSTVQEAIGSLHGEGARRWT